jgi:CubicO group peptidase (beta-lactamase class C family)
VRSILARAFFTLALAATTTALAAQALPADAAAKIDAVVAAEQARQKIPGLSIAVAFKDTLIYSRAYGSANLEHGIATKPSTAFRTASVAKPLTATAVMALVEAGKMDLDAPIRTYCPAWPAKHPIITARQLLGHLAGVRHYTKRGESTGKTHYFSLVDSLALFKYVALLHEPG